FALSGVLAPNVNYSGTILVKNASALTDSRPLAFDTFLTNVFTVEIEEYNFTTNFDININPIGPARQFIDNYPNCSPSHLSYGDYACGGTYPRPETLCENCTAPYAYNGLVGCPAIDFHSSHGPHKNYNPDHSFRFDDNVQTERSGEVRRGFYASAGPPGDGE